jgi:CDP-4-dehydro-6-deoxyglucose reductase
VVSDLCGWEGRCGMLHEAVCEDIADLNPARLCQWLAEHDLRHPRRLVEAGMDAHRMRADVFAYAPRG